jgi:hypothetical protein
VDENDKNIKSLEFLGLDYYYYYYYYFAYFLRYSSNAGPPNCRRNWAGP